MEDFRGRVAQVRSAFALAFAVLSFAAVSLADGRDGLLHWWKVTDLNGDGLLQPEEFRDVMTRGAVRPKTGTTVYQATEGVSADRLVGVETAEVEKPTMRTTVREPVIRFRNPTNWVDGQLHCNYQALSADGACIGRRLVDGVKEGTVFIRFKWDGRRFKKKDASYNHAVTLYGDGWDAWGGRGWRVGFRTYDSSAPNEMYPHFSYGNSEKGFYMSPHNTRFLVKAGVWYEMAVTFRHEVIDGEDRLTRAVMLRGSTTGRGRYAYDRREGAFTPVWAEDAVDGARISLGYHSTAAGSLHGLPGGTAFVAADAAGDDSFVGLIHEVKAYTKYMDEFELQQTMADSDPDVMIGSRNGSADEFSDVGAAAEYEPDAMLWERMKKTFSPASPHATVAFALEENGHALGRLVEMRFLKATPFAGERIDVALNGARFGSKAIPADGEVRFFLKPGRLARVAKDPASGLYPLKLTVSRGDAVDSAVTLDYLSVGGAWQLGADDGKSDEFGTAADLDNYSYVLGQRDAAECCLSIANKSPYASARLYFALSDWAAAHTKHRLTLRGAGSALAVPAFVTVNDDTANRLALPSGPAVCGADGTNVCLGAGALKGATKVEFSCAAENPTTPSWSKLDFWRLETILPDDFRNSDTGMAFVIR